MHLCHAPNYLEVDWFVWIIRVYRLVDNHYLLTGLSSAKCYWNPNIQSSSMAIMIQGHTGTHAYTYHISNIFSVHRILKKYCSEQINACSVICCYVFQCRQGILRCFIKLELSTDIIDLELHVESNWCFHVILEVCTHYYLLFKEHLFVGMMSRVNP